MSLTDKALALTSGFTPVFPLRADKVPTTENGFKDAVVWPDAVVRLFADPAAALIGVPTGAVSGFFAVDIDPDKGGTDWFVANQHRLPATRTHRTRRDGFHLLFKHRAGVRCSAGAPARADRPQSGVAPGVDIRGDDGYIAWWPAAGIPIESDAEITDAPDWLYDDILRAQHGLRGELKAPLNPGELAPTSAGHVLRLLKAMPNPPEVGRDEYISICLAVQGTIRGGLALDVLDEEDADEIMDAAAAWAARWEGPTPGDFEAERQKWDDDWSKRDNDVSGWRNLVSQARRLGADVAPFTEALVASDFAGEPLPPADPRTVPAAAAGHGADVFDPWEHATPPGFPMHVLPQLLRDVAQDQAERTGAEQQAVAMALLAGTAGCVDGRTSVRVKRHDPSWLESPRLWVMLVGDPSAKKTPTISAALGPLRRLEAKAAAEYRAKKEAWDRLPKDQRIGQPPVHSRFILNDTTTEKAAELLSENPRGLLSHRDELAGWIGDMERYGKGQNASARAFWLEAYNGGYYVQDRIARGTISVANLSISILGGIQPDRLRSISEGLTDDGLLQRFLPVLMGRAGADADRPPDMSNLFFDEHISRLIAMPARSLYLDPAGHDIREATFAQFRDLETYSGAGRGFQAWCGKASAFMMRLAMALHFADPNSVSATDGLLPASVIERAAELTLRFCVRHAAAFYQDIASSVQETTQRIAEWLLTTERNEFSTRDFSRGPRVLRGADAKALREKLSPLETGGWLLPEDPDPRVNRRWTLAPGVREQFSAKAAEIAERNARVIAKLRGDAE